MYNIIFKTRLKDREGNFKREVTSYITQTNTNKQGYSVDIGDSWTLSVSTKESIKRTAKEIWQKVVVEKEVDPRVFEIMGEYLEPSTVEELGKYIEKHTPEILEDLILKSEISSEGQHKSSTDFIKKNPDKSKFITETLNKREGLNHNPTTFSERSRYNKLQSEISSIYVQHEIVAKSTLEDFIEKNKKETELAYKNSVVRLAYRLGERGVSEIKKIMVMRVSNERMDCFIKTQTGEMLNCYTIVASGPIQQPHLRYLIQGDKK